MVGVMMAVVMAAPTMVVAVLEVGGVVVCGFLCVLPSHLFFVCVHDLRKGWIDVLSHSCAALLFAVYGLILCRVAFVVCPTIRR